MLMFWATGVIALGFKLGFKGGVRAKAGGMRVVVAFKYLTGKVKEGAAKVGIFRFLVKHQEKLY